MDLFKNLIDELKESMGQKLNSTYFITVLVVWVVSLRSILYGIYAFDDSISFDQQLNWIHQEFNKKDFFGLKGFYGTVIFALTWGFPYMVIYYILLTAAKAVQKWAYAIHVLCMKKLKQTSYVDENKYNRLLQKNKVLRESNAQLLEARESDSILRSDLEKKEQQLKELTQTHGEKTIEIQNLKDKLNQRPNTEPFDPKEFFQGSWLATYLGKGNLKQEFIVDIDGKYYADQDIIYRFEKCQRQGPYITFNKIRETDKVGQQVVLANELVVDENNNLIGVENSRQIIYSKKRKGLDLSIR